ncbi:MAG TPA: LamG domain-containing protein [Planctomycetota bacterium]|nr:LamG domain-containing protein [Planctomycetota bacterium]
MNRVIAILVAVVLWASLSGRAGEPIDLKAGLLAHWTFDETEGKVAKDSSGNNIDAMLEGGAMRCDGRIGRGVHCDGIDGAVRIVRNPKLESKDGTTIALWALIEARAQDEFHDLVRHHAGRSGVCFRWKHGSQILQFRVDRRNNGPVYAVDKGSNERYLNAWHYFAGTFDAKTGIARLYVDGELHAEARGNPGPLEYTGDTCIFHATEGAMTGVVDEVRLYDRALSEAEIKALASVMNPPSSLVGYWSFNEVNGTSISDSSGNVNHGKLNGGTWTSGKYGNALELDGRVNCVTVADAALLDLDSQLSISVWIRASKDARPGAGSTILKKTDHYALTYVDDHTLRFAVGASGEIDVPIQSIADWSHVVGTYDGSIGRVYVNGVLAGEKSIQRKTAKQRGELCIGASVKGATDCFHGVIDEVRLYSGALSGTEVDALYKAKTAPVPAASHH